MEKDWSEKYSGSGIDRPYVNESPQQYYYRMARHKRIYCSYTGVGTIIDLDTGRRICVEQYKRKFGIVDRRR